MRLATPTMLPVVADDEPFLFALFEEVNEARLNLSAMPPDLRAPLMRQQFEAHREHYRSPEMDLTDWIIQIEGQPVGRMTILENDREIRIADLAIVAAHRRKGIATAAVQGKIKEAVSSGRALRLHVAKFGDEDALRLYTRLGFVPIEDRGLHWFMGWSPQGGGMGNPMAPG